jgi:tetratricopeptide (TPR) repeat protein
MTRAIRFASAAVLLVCSTCAVAAAQAKSDSSGSSASFQSLASQADSAREAGQLDKAIALYRSALALNPRWMDGWWALGTLHYDADDYASAVDAFRHVLTLDPQHGTALAMLGLSEFELGQDVDALRDIEASKQLGILKDEQLRKVVLFHEGLLLQRAGRFYLAQRALGSLCLGGVRSRELVETLGMTVLRMRDRLPPSQASEQAFVVEHLGRAACLEGAKNYDLARSGFDSVTTRFPNTPNVHYAYGRFLLDEGDRDAAVKEFQLQLAGKPDDLLTRLLLAATEIKVNDTAGLAVAEEAVRMAPREPLAHFVLGALLLDAGKDTEAIPHLEIARAGFPNEPKIYWSLGTAYARAGRTKDAAEMRSAFERLRQKTTDVNDSDLSEPLISDQIVNLP